MTVVFVVRGCPVPLARHRSGRHGTYLPKRSRDYRSLVQAEWLAAGRQTLGDRPFTASLRFYGARPTADVSNLAKAVEDALNGLAYVDDRQVVRLDAVKLPVDADGLRCEVELQEVIAGCL
jgi:Holliday junction resolvase RusA-like endonuclease